MNPSITGHEAISRDDLAVHEWRVTQLTRLGVPGCWPRSTPTASTGIRSRGWLSAAAPRGWPSALPSDARIGPPRSRPGRPGFNGQQQGPLVRSGLRRSRQVTAGDPVSPSFVWGHRNKRSVGLDLRSAEGRELFLSLAKASDIVLGDFPARQPGIPRARVRRAAGGQPGDRGRGLQRAGPDRPGKPEHGLRAAGLSGHRADGAVALPGPARRLLRQRHGLPRANRRPDHRGIPAWHG